MNQAVNYSKLFYAESGILNLSQRDLSKIPKDVIEIYGSCALQLDISHNRFGDLSWIYEFPALEEVILDNNRVCETYLSRLSVPLDNIRVLMLNKNEFCDLHTTVAQLKRVFPNLEHLSLHGNAICPDGLGLRPFSTYINYDYSYYRSYILSIFPRLKFLDHATTDEIDYWADMSAKTHWFMSYRPEVLWKKFRAYLRRLPLDRFKSQNHFRNFNISKERNQIIGNEGL